MASIDPERLGSAHFLRMERDRLAQLNAQRARAAGVNVKMSCRPEGREMIGLHLVLEGTEYDDRTMAAFARTMLYAIRVGIELTPEQIGIANKILADDPAVESPPSPVCANCMHWSDKTAWTGSSAEVWGTARECRNPALGAASSHVASPNYDGRPTTLPDFGCNQFEAKP